MGRYCEIRIGKSKMSLFQKHQNSHAGNRLGHKVNAKQRVALHWPRRRDVCHAKRLK